MKGIHCSDFLRFCSVVSITLGLSGGIAFASANPAFDGASNYASPGWSATPTNAGTGFGAWDIIVQNDNSPPYAGTYLDTSSNIKSNGDSWGIYANNPATNAIPEIHLLRPFTGTGGAALASGDTFSVDLTSQGIGTGTSAGLGFSLETYSGSPGYGSPQLTLAYFGSTTNNNMVLEDSSGTTNKSTGITYAELATGIVVSVTEGISDAYTITVTPFKGGAALFTASGTTTGLMSQVDVFDDNTSANGYFNNLAITIPEPSSIALVGLGLFGAMAVRRRKP